MIGDLYKIKEAVDSWISYCNSEHTNPYGLFTVKSIESPRGIQQYTFEEMRGSFNAHRFTLVAKKQIEVKEL